MTTPLQTATQVPAAIQKVIVVNGNSEILGLLDDVLDEGRYDMVFVESSDRAYSQVRKVLPNLIILCSTPADLHTCQLLTMLKMDVDTCDIPVLTYTPDTPEPDMEAVFADMADDDVDMLPVRPAPRMN